MIFQKCYLVRMGAGTKMELHSKDDTMDNSILKKQHFEIHESHSKKYMHQILNLSLDAYDEMFSEIDTTNLVERKGIIYVWTNKNKKQRIRN